ncbi:MAG: hypothetical protein Q9168_002924 [Polycauliona sp. 1 TL-2023]
MDSASIELEAMDVDSADKKIPIEGSFTMGKIFGRVLSMEESAMIGERAEENLEIKDMPLFKIWSSDGSHLTRLNLDLICDPIFKCTGDEFLTEDGKIDTEQEDEYNYYLTADETFQFLIDEMNKVRKAHPEIVRALALRSCNTDSDTEASKHLEATKHDPGFGDGGLIPTKATSSQPVGSKAYRTSASITRAHKDSIKLEDPMILGEYLSDSEETDDRPRGRSPPAIHKAIEIIVKKPGEPVTEVETTGPLEKIPDPVQDPTRLQMPAASDYRGIDDPYEGRFGLERSQMLPSEQRTVREERLRRRDSVMDMD